MKNSSQNSSADKLGIIASRINSRMRERGLTITELARRSDALAHDIYEDSERPNITRERISKILMNKQSHVGRGVAKIVSKSEITVLSEVLSVAPEQLANETSSELPAYSNTAGDPKYARQLAHLMNYY